MLFRRSLPPGRGRPAGAACELAALAPFLDDTVIEVTGEDGEKFRWVNRHGSFWQERQSWTREGE